MCRPRADIASDGQVVKSPYPCVQDVFPIVGAYDVHEFVAVGFNERPIDVVLRDCLHRTFPRIGLVA